MGCGGSKKEHDPKHDPKKDNLPKKYQISESSLEDFLSCEKDAKIYMERHVVETLKVRLDQKKHLEKNLKRMEEKEHKLREEIHRNKMHVPHAQDKGHVPHAQDKGHGPKEKHSSGRKLVKDYLMDHEDYNSVTAYEKADHIASLNKWEMLKKEIYGTKQHIVELTHECQMLQEDCQDLTDIWEMRNKILDSLFGGEYGSDKENQLEDELDYLHYKQQKYEECNFKWRQAQVMIVYSCKQIGMAVKKWREIIKLPMSSMEPRYQLAEETRNNLIAATQNLNGAHSYVPYIQFPYCTPEEVKMLSKATSYVFTDMQAKARQAHALECYTAVHKRCGALLQWFNETINTVIMQNLTKVKDRVKVVAKELRKERIQLICKLIHQKFGKKVEVKPQDLDFDIEEPELPKEQLPGDEKNGKPSEYNRGSYAKLDYLAVPDHPPPLPLNELAELPTKAQLFGSLDEIKAHLKESNMNKKNEENGHGKPGQRRNRAYHLKINHHNDHHNNDHHYNNDHHNKNDHYNKDGHHHKDDHHYKNDHHNKNDHYKDDHHYRNDYYKNDHHKDEHHYRNDHNKDGHYKDDHHYRNDHHNKDGHYKDDPHYKKDGHHLSDNHINEPHHKMSNHQQPHARHPHEVLHNEDYEDEVRRAKKKYDRY